MRRLHPLIGKGLSAAVVYTQTTDVEVEVNGLMTYDREVLKFDAADMKKWHQQLFTPPPKLSEVVPTSQKVAQEWAYSLTKPADDQWLSVPEKQDKFAVGKGGFGTKGTPGAVIGTEWKTDDIWLRRTFELKDVPEGEVLLRIHHDEDAEVYINGVPAAKVPGYVSDYYEVDLSADARKALKKGQNVLSVHCHQTGGGQYIDVGLVQVVPAKK